MATLEPVVQERVRRQGSDSSFGSVDGLLGMFDRLSAEDRAEIRELALSIFDTPQDAFDFLLKPHPRFEGMPPAIWLGNASGIERVKTLLASVAYGLPA